MYILRLVLILLVLTLVGCGFESSEKYEMRQRIEMGPFVFWIDDVWEKNFRPLKVHGTWKIIYASVRLQTSESKPSTSFEGFLNNKVRGLREYPYPAMAIVDDHGISFYGYVTHIGGDTYRFETYFNGDPGVLDKQLQDFQLEIKNLDPRKGQPRLVTIQLR